MQYLTFRWTVCLALFLITLAGCGGADHPPTVPVTGTLTLSGQPVAGATIAFTGEEHTALAISGDDGRFQLTTFNEGDGAVEGDYRITAVKMISAGIAAAGGDDSMEAAVADSEKEQDATGSQSVLPSRYSDPNTSGLRVTVKRGEENDFALELSP